MIKYVGQRRCPMLKKFKYMRLNASDSSLNRCARWQHQLPRHSVTMYLMPKQWRNVGVGGGGAVHKASACMYPYFFPHSNFGQSGFSQHPSIIFPLYIRFNNKRITRHIRISSLLYMQPSHSGGAKSHASQEEMYKPIWLVHFMLQYRYRGTCQVGISIQTSNILTMVFPGFTQPPKRKSGKGLRLRNDLLFRRNPFQYIIFIIYQPYRHSTIHCCPELKAVKNEPLKILAQFGGGGGREGGWCSQF